MAQLTVAITENIIARALDSLEPQAPAAGDGTVLYSSALDLFEAATVDAWNRLRAVVEAAARQGATFVQDEIETFVDFVNQTGRELGARGDEFLAWVLQRVRELTTRTFDYLLGSLRSEVVIGERTYVLESIELQQKLVYSGSLKTSLVELCAFAGGGEFVLGGSYRAAARSS